MQPISAAKARNLTWNIREKQKNQKRIDAAKNFNTSLMCEVIRLLFTKIEEAANNGCASIAVNWDVYGELTEDEANCVLYFLHSVYGYRCEHSTSWQHTDIVDWECAEEPNPKCFKEQYPGLYELFVDALRGQHSAVNPSATIIGSIKRSWHSLLGKITQHNTGKEGK